MCKVYVNIRKLRREKFHRDSIRWVSKVIEMVDIEVLYQRHFNINMLDLGAHIQYLTGICSLIKKM